MKSFFLILTSVLIFIFTASSQVAIQNQVNPGDYRPYEIKIKKKIRNDSKLFFEIIDLRTDTTRLGFMKDNFQQIYFHFNKPAATYLSSKINTDELYKDTVCIFLHKLWVYESLVPKKKANDKSEKSQGDRLLCFGRIAADVCIKTEGKLVKLFHYDSTISTRGYMANNVDYLISKNMSFFLQMTDSAMSTSSKDAISKNELLKPEIFQPPILSTSTFKNGIYPQFEDFLNNRPADIKFTYEVKKKKESFQLTEPRADDSLYTKYSWGFCINGQPYMRIGESFSRLTKIENSFELRAIDAARFYLYKGFTPNNAAFAGISIIAFANPAWMISDLLQTLVAQDKYFAQYENISAFKLDLKTGELY